MQPPQDSSLAGPRIRFDRLRLENIYTHFKWSNDPELNRLDTEVPYVEESFGTFKRRFEHLIAQRDPESEDFEIYDEEDTLIGVAFVSGISGHHLHCTIGVTIGERDFWSKGYGKEAMKVLLRHCFESLGMHRVEAGVFEYNEAWRRLVEGCGFVTEGTDRDYLFWEGRFYDRIRYAMLSSEYGRVDRPASHKRPTSIRPAAPDAAA